MREIKFRAWDTSRNEWHYFVISPTPENIDRTTSFGSRIHNYLVPFIAPDSWGQYTGLKDKNGKEIYEGDILKCGGGDMIYIEDVKLKYSPSRGYSVDYGYGSKHNFPAPYWVEAIDNIYENPKMMESVSEQ